MRPRAEPQSREKTGVSRLWRTRGRNDLAQKKKRCAGNGGIVSRQTPLNGTPHHRIRVGRAEIGAVCSMPSVGGRAPSRSSWTIPRSMRRSTRTCSTTKVAEDYPPRVARRESRLRPTSQPPRRTNGRVPRRVVNRIHAVAPTETAPRQAKTSRQAREGHSDLRHRENHMIAGNGGRDGENGAIAARKIVDRVIAKAV